jgi:hypothetical protein
MGFEEHTVQKAMRHLLIAHIIMGEVIQQRIRDIVAYLAQIQEK